ncbi:MAG: MFS transporter [Oscillospiraceae bacterium]|nr:MFS transporter [Oscillospiraceae bacterium]
MTHLLLVMIYLSFISLGLPDALLGSAWPTIYPQLGVPISYAGVISMIISVGTILSSLQSDRLTRRFGAGKVTAVSVGLTAAAIFGFSLSGSFWMLCLWAIPYGLGAGSVDAALNNYVAIHYASRHMSWLHCMWGVGATAGPYIMGFALAGGYGWNGGYRGVALLQILLTLLLAATLSLWKEEGLREASEGEARGEKPLTLPQVLAIPGVRAVIAMFFCYCALESAAGLWAGSYLTLERGVEAGTAARYAGLFYLGITVGRGVCGFLTLRLGDHQMIRLGQGIILLGAAALLLPLGPAAALAGLILVGLGCAPIYPSIIHSIPELFGAQRSQAIIGVQMASAYTGSLLMPPLFGVLANHLGTGLLPLFLLGLLALMVFGHERLLKKSAGEKREGTVTNL